MPKTSHRCDQVPATRCLGFRAKRTCTYSKLPRMQVGTTGSILFITGSEFLAFGQVILK